MPESPRSLSHIKKDRQLSLYKAFPPEEARKLAERFEWHYTPKHGRWLDVAEIEIGIMSRQSLGKLLPDLESFKQQVRTWTIGVMQNAQKSTGSLRRRMHELN